MSLRKGSISNIIIGFGDVQVLPHVCINFIILNYQVKIYEKQKVPGMNHQCKEKVIQLITDKSSQAENKAGVHRRKNY